mmetsp:Transcript_81022/g.161578  ORF Transcript_81022/g.161578 Transcript_81022/m.161578 type:complete len:311 (-) Transcript_81022:183-1115(-)
MLCSSYAGFWAVWSALTVASFATVIVMSGFIFKSYYVNPTFETWRYKSNPKYPTPEMVRMEIIQLAKGVSISIFSPALSIWLAGQDSKWSKAYCGVREDLGWSHLALEVCVIVLLSDFFEFFYHYCGHYFTAMWTVHKHHHVFYNPTPFAVIADEYVDQFMRATPLVWLPLLMPINCDLLFAVYALFFYGYGVYLHWGFETDLLPAGHPIMNTSFQHYAHHAVSVKNRPLHCGFFFKVWDQLFGSMYTGGTVISALEARQRGLRTREAWEKVVKPDYTPLLKPSFYFTGGKSELQSKTTQEHGKDAAKVA